MTTYAIRPELAKAGHLYSIDYSKPSLRPVIRAMVAQYRRSSGAYVPPPGVKIQKAAFSGEGTETVDCFVVEPEAAEKGPAMLYCHGGGFFLPLQPCHLALAAAYALQTGVRVFLPEYRILPEYRCPAAFNDCLAVWNGMNARTEEFGIAPGQLLLYGESAGGALSCGIALKDRDEGKSRAKGQLLIYPVLDDRSSLYESMELYSEAPWSKNSNRFMWEEYLKEGTAGMGQYLIPMRHKELAGLPFTYLEPQEIDVLRDEGCAFAGRLREAGVRVEIQVIKGSYHGFDSETDNSFVKDMIRERALQMKRCLGTC